MKNYIIKADRNETFVTNNEEAATFICKITKQRGVVDAFGCDDYIEDVTCHDIDELSDDAKEVVRLFFKFNRVYIDRGDDHFITRAMFEREYKASCELIDGEYDYSEEDFCKDYYEEYEF